MNQPKQPKPMMDMFQIEGTVPLLQAMQKTLQLGGYTCTESHVYKHEMIICGYNDPKSEEERKSVVLTSKAFGEEYKHKKVFQLPQQWDEAIKYVKAREAFYQKTQIKKSFGKLNLQKVEDDVVRITHEDIEYSQMHKRIDVIAYLETVFEFEVLNRYANYIAFGCTRISEAEAKEIIKFLS